MKVCPKCDELHEKPGTFCSRKCANSRTFSKESKKKKSEANKAFYDSPEGTKRKKESSRRMKQELSQDDGRRKSFAQLLRDNRPKMTEETKKKISESRMGVSTITEEGRRRLSQYAKDKELGGINSKQKIWYTKKDGTEVFLQSSFELLVARELDKYDIKWNRPAYVKWIDSSGVDHKYYPDFYLEEYDVYLDPKNDYLIKRDREKITAVTKQNNVTVLVLNEENLTWDKIKNMLE